FRMSLKEGHSRYPVYRGTLDDVIGMIHIKDLAQSIAATDPATAFEGAEDAAPIPKLGDLIRKVLFVSPAIRVLDLLLEMRLKRTHMALVVDEFGGIDGLVTIENVVEQIVGEIEDEHDSDQAPELAEQEDGSAIADGRLTLAAFEERYGQILTDDEREESDTLAGLLARLAGRVPARNELIKHHSGLEFEVLESDPRRVRRLKIPRPPERPREQPPETA
ncbi:MAG: CBS domain-containing protein, partial [Alphaproteobacteria bacterium]|nr:CBS domain-containing protein [Alphaproteobacteria bacterium]